MVQVSRDLKLGDGVLRRWVKELALDPRQAFPGQGQPKPEQQELDLLRREVAKLKAERDDLDGLRIASSRNAPPTQLQRPGTTRVAADVVILSSSPLWNAAQWRRRRFSPGRCGPEHQFMCLVPAPDFKPTLHGPQ